MIGGGGATKGNDQAVAPPIVALERLQAQKDTNIQHRTFLDKSIKRNAKLFWTSLTSELFGLFACVVVGFVVGLVGAAMELHDPDNAWAESESYLPWPNDSMKSRGDPLALLVGLCIAIPSGMGVALSVTGDNAGGLVGVAISASLLPPMVNAGMCMGIAAISHDEDVAVRGAYSLCLTLVNIIAIMVASFLTFRFKKLMDPRDFKNPFFVHHGTHQKNEASRDEMENLTSAVMQATKRPVRQDADSSQPETKVRLALP